MYGVTCQNLANVLKTGFDDVLKSMYGVGIEEIDMSPDNLRKILEFGPPDMFVPKEEDGAFVMETAPPISETKAPTAKWICNLLDVRDYMEAFVPEFPYDPDSDTFKTSEYSQRLSVANGAVVYNRTNKRKPVKYIYASIAKFLGTLSGEILIVGDPNCTVNLRCENQHWSTPVGDIFSAIEYEYAGKNSEKMIEYTMLEAFFSRQKIEHIVYCFSGERLVQHPTARCHYLSLIAGTNGIKACERTGEFLLMGKLLTLSAYPKGSIVSQSLLAGDNHKYDSNMIWYTDVIKTQRVSSMIPLSAADAIGKLKDIYISDKLDGVPLHIVVESNIAKIYFSTESEIPFGQFDWVVENQVLVCELHDGNTISVCEPLIHPCNLFGSWLKKKYTSFRVKVNKRKFLITFKRWYPFPDDGDWEKYAHSKEGIVLKNSLSPVGSFSMRYSKLDTYFLKLLNRVSYEDKVSFCRCDYLGVHGLYFDPNKIYDGPGIYEVLAFERILYRKRKKDVPDPHWYVVAVTHPPVINRYVKTDGTRYCESSIFRYNVLECDYFPTDGGTLRLENHKVVYGPGTVQRLDGSRSVRISGKGASALKVGDHVKFYGLIYVVTSIHAFGAVAHLPPARVKIKDKIKS